MGIGLRRALAVLGVIGLAGCGPRTAGPVPADGAEASPRETRAGAPRFEDFPAGPAYGGPIAAVDLQSHPRAAEFRTALSRGAAQGPNFAGRYTVVSWSCGTMCQEFMIIDAATGQVHSGGHAALGVEHRADSRLLLINPPERVAETTCAPGVCTPRYLEWTGTRLEPVLAPAERRALLDAASEYVRGEAALERFTLELMAVADDFARARVVPEPGTTDPAVLYLRRENGRWRGLAIGTAFAPEDLDELRIPRSVRPHP